MSHGNHPPTCYMSGVNIRTARGDVAIEAIELDELVVVIRDGREVLEPVLWIGHSTVDLSHHPHVEDAAPVRIRQGAIAVDQPARDLLLSPEHCLILDGRCVPAKLLVNGGSIISERDHPPFIYYHLELERHAILLAENTPSESYLDTGNRYLFDNAGDPRHLHPALRVNAVSSRWATDACVPLAKTPDEVGLIWSRLAKRSVELGFPVSTVRTTGDADLHVVADGDAIQPISDSESHYVFLVPAGVKSVSLVSRFCIPSDKMISDQRDTRRLGVRVNWLSIQSVDDETILAADHPALQAGWNAVENAPGSMWRWTDGNASIPWNKATSSAVLTVRCTPVDEYPIYDAKLRLVA